MKNIRLLFSTLCLFSGLGSNVLFAQTKVVVPGPVALEVERVEITKEQAAAYVASGDKITVPVYLVLKEDTWTSNDWKQFCASNSFSVNSSRLSFAFFEDETYTLGNWLQNPRDNITICANVAFPGPTDGGARCDAGGDRDWYVDDPAWQLESGGTGNLPYPSYAYGAGFSGGRLYLDEKYVIQDGNNFKIHLFSIQFTLKNGTRNYPIALVDENYPLGLDGSTGATELNLGNPGYTISYTWKPEPTGTPDWTQGPASAFSFISGGLFIANGPEVGKFEPYFEAGFGPSFCPGDDVVLKAEIKLPSGAQRGKYYYDFGNETHTSYMRMDGNSSVNPQTGTGAWNGVKMEFTDGSAPTTDNTTLQLKITIPSNIYTALTGVGSGGVVTNNRFRLSVLDKADATKELSAKDTVAKVFDYKKIYLHVSDQSALSNNMLESFTRVHPGSPKPDTVKGMPSNSQVYVRYSCVSPTTSGLSVNCYMSPMYKMDGINLNSVDLLKPGNPLPPFSGDRLQAQVFVGMDNAAYYARHTWSNGCVTETDTVVLVPAKVYEAPKITLSYNNCATDDADKVKFDLSAAAPVGVTPTRWTWVIRHEMCAGCTAGTIGSASTATAPTGCFYSATSCLDFAAPDNDPLKAPTTIATKDYFGGGVVFHSGDVRTSKFLQSSMHLLNYTMGVSALGSNPSQSSFTVSATATSGTYNVYANYFQTGPSLWGHWVPVPDKTTYPEDLPAGTNGTGCYTGDMDVNVNTIRSTYASALHKWIYVQYETADGGVSEWAAIQTPTEDLVAAANAKPSDGVTSLYDKGSYMGISPWKYYISGGSTSVYDKPGTTFRVQCDTTIAAGQPVQFYLVTNLGQSGSKPTMPVATEIETNIIWQYSEDDGNTWNILAETPVGTTIGGTSSFFRTENNGNLNAYPAPLVVNPTKKTMYRVVWNSACANTQDKVDFDRSVPFTVLMESLLKKGEIVGVTDTGNAHKNYGMCEDELLLLLTDKQDGATYQWYWSDQETSGYQIITGATSDRYTYVPRAWASQSEYESGIPKYFKVITTLGGESVESPTFKVQKYYVLKPSLSTVVPATVPTSGVCVGTTVGFACSVANNMWSTATQEAQMSMDGTAYSNMPNTPSGTTQKSISFNAGEAYNNLYFRMENTMNGCTAYSDTVQMKVVKKPVEGNIQPTSFCPGTPVTFDYNGTDNNYFRWQYKDGSATTYTTVADTTARSITFMIPESAMNGNKATLRIYPMNRSIAAKLNGAGNDTTVCAIAAQDQEITKANNCDVTLAANPTSFCEGDWKDVTLTMTPPQAATSGIVLKHAGTDGWVDMPAGSYTLNAATANGYETLTVKASYFKDNVAGGKTEYFAVVVTPQGGSALNPSSPAIIKVNAAPTITNNIIALNPADVCAGESMMIGSALAGTGTTSYKWLYAGSASDTLNRVFTEVAASDSGTPSGMTGTILTLNTTRANYTTLNGNFYGLTIAAESSDNCWAYDTTPFIQPVINPLPDTGNFVTKFSADAMEVTTPQTVKTVSLSACSGTSVTLSAVTNPALQDVTGTLPHTGYTYEWTVGGAAVTPTTGTVTSTANTGSTCVIPAGAATAGLKTYKLKITASALKKNGNAANIPADYGCPRSVELTYLINYNDCGKDKLTDGTSTEYGKAKAYMVCADDPTWPSVKVVPADLPAATSGNAPVTSVKLYHATVKDGPYTEVTDVSFGPASNYTLNLTTPPATDVKKSVGSHYYYAKIERTGYSPTYTDTAEYLVGAMPDVTYSGAGVYLSTASPVPGDAASTLAVCAGTPVHLQVRGLADNGNDATGSTTPDPAANTSYTWYKTSSAPSTLTPQAVPPTADQISGQKAATYSLLGIGQAAASDAGYYYAYRTYERATKTANTTPEDTKTCPKSFPVTTVAQLTVNPIPTPVTAVEATNKDLCDGETFTLQSKITTPAAATPAGTTYKYRWYKQRTIGNGAAGINDQVYPVTAWETLDANNDMTITKPTGVITASADGNTEVVKDVYKLGIIATTADGCVDSASLEGFPANLKPAYTVIITPKPKFEATASVSAADICAGSTANFTSSLANPSDAATKYTLVYKWYKTTASDGTQNHAATGGDAVVATGATYNISNATTANSGYYYLAVTAQPKSPGKTACDTTIYTESVQLTVHDNPVFGTAYSVKTGGIAGSYNATICTSDETEIVFTPATGTDYNINANTGNSATDGYTWTSKFNGTPTVCGHASVDYHTYTISSNYTQNAGTIAVSLQLRYKSNTGSCPGDTTLNFTVTVSACSADELQNGRDNSPADKAHPLTVCANEPENTWPTVRVLCQNMNSKEVKEIKLYHSTDKTGPYTEVATQNVAAGQTAPAHTFDPTAAAAKATLMAVGSHYYYAAVTRDDGSNKAKYTDTVEYVVGAVPAATVIGSASIMVSTETSQAAALAAGANNELRLCAGPDTYLYLKDMPATLSAGVTHTKYEWYKGTSATVPATPAAAITAGATAEGGDADNVSLGAATATVTTTDYYYSYHRYSQNTPVYSTGVQKACDTVYPIKQAGVRIVDPMPSKPTVTYAGFTVCEGETFNLTPTLTPNAPPSTDNPATTWEYRWFKDGLANANIFSPADGSLASTPDVTGITAANTGTTPISNSYKLRVYATNGLCSDSVTFDGVTVSVNPKPSASTPDIKAYTGTGFGTLSTDGKVCETKQIQIKPTATITYTSGGINTDAGAQWFKLNAGETCPSDGKYDLSKATPVPNGGNYATGGTADNPTLTITANDNSVSGTYFLMLPLRRGDCLDTAYSTACVDITFVAKPKVSIASGSALTFNLCAEAGKTATMSVTLDDATQQEVTDGAATVTYEWYKGSAKLTGAGAPTTGTYTVTLGTDLPATANTNATYYVQITKTAANSVCDSVLLSSAPTAKGGLGGVFTINLQDCGKDIVRNDREPNSTYTKTKPFVVCDGDPTAAWPIVKIDAINMADLKIKDIELKYRFGDKTGPFVQAKSQTVADLTTASLTFDPQTETIGGEDVKKPGSHYYVGIVTREDGSKSTDTVEYFVAKRPELDVVNGELPNTSIVVSTHQFSPDPAETNRMEICPSTNYLPSTWLHLRDLPNTGDNGETSLKNPAYAWYQGTNATVPSTKTDADLAADVTSKGTGLTAGPDLAANTGTTPVTNYYYAYISYSRTSSPVTAPATTKTCDTTYRVKEAGVRIVNPQAKLPTTMAHDKVEVCEGETFSLTPKLDPESASDNTWTYRWYKKVNGQPDFVDANIFYPADKTQEASGKDVTDIVATLANPKVGVTEYYKLAVYAVNAYCRDTIPFTNAVTVKINAKPYIEKDPVIALSPAGGEVCAGEQLKMTVTIADMKKGAGTTLNYEWYKLRDEDGATPDPTKDTLVIQALPDVTVSQNATATSVTFKTYDITRSGKYYLMVPMSVSATSGGCLNTAYSNVVDVAVKPRPDVRIKDTSLMTYSLCVGSDEETTLSIGLDDETKQQVADGTATVSYEWHKGSRTGATVGANAPSLTVKATDIAAGDNNKYYVKVTKTIGSVGCPTTLWIDSTWYAEPATSGMGKPFNVIGVNCGPDKIVETPEPAVDLNKNTAVAICSAEADPGKSFSLKASTTRGADTVTWHYGKVNADGSMGTVTPLLPGCIATIAADAIGCEFKTKDNGMTSAGEWRIWAKVGRKGANPTTTDTITFVIRPNPTLTNEAALAMQLAESNGTTLIPDWLVCQGTEVKLKLSAKPELDTYTDITNETHKDSVGYDWKCTNCGSGSSYAWSTEDRTFVAAMGGSPKPTASGISGAPAEASYANVIRLNQEYKRRFQRTATPAYDISCKVMKDGAVYVKTFDGTIYASETPKGTLLDADNKTASTHCASAIDATSKVTLTMTPNSATPQTEVTQWQWSDKETPSLTVDADWYDWAAADATTPNSIDLLLNDSRLVKPAAGQADKKYTFRAKLKNGKCEGSVGTYTVTFVAAAEAGSVTVAEAFCADAATQVKVDAANVKPATATVTFGIYTNDPGTATATGDKATGSVNCTGGAATWTGSFNASALTAPTDYYVRYTVTANTPCTDVHSTVKKITVYPAPTFTFGTNATELCLTDDATVDLNFTVTNATEIKLYAFGETRTDAQVDAAVPLKTLTADEINAGKVTVNGSDMFADDAKKQDSKTYFYIVAKQTAAGLPAACAEVRANTDIKTAEPVVKPVIGWDAAATVKNTGPVETNERRNVYILNGDNALDTTLYSAVKKTDDTDPDWDHPKSESVKTNPYNFQAYDVDELHVWLLVKGYNGCMDERSDTITITVQKSEKYTAERKPDVCSNDEIVCWIKPGSGAGGIKAGSYKWQYTTHGGSTWTDVPATVPVGDLDSCKLVWANHGLAAGTYDFRMAYESESGKKEETLGVDVKVHARPTLSATDALNLPDATCEGTPFAVKLKDGVTATGTQNLLFCADDPDADGAVWTSKATTAGTLSYSASALADSGNYRLIVYNAQAPKDVCDTMESEVRLLQVNAQPKAGTLTIAPDPQCFGQDVTVTLDGDVKGKVVDYEYHPNHSGTPATDRPASPAPADKVWRSIGTPSDQYPITPDDDYVADADGNYPAIWTLKNVKYGYSIRAKVTNGVCDAVYALDEVNIKDTVKITTDPTDQRPMVGESDGLPNQVVVFNGAAGPAGGTYLDGSAFALNTGTITYQWYMAKDGSTWEPITGETGTGLTLQTSFWSTNGIDGDGLTKVRFRLAATDAVCTQTVYSKEAKIVPQAELKAGEIIPTHDPTKAPKPDVNCFYYGDTVILVHDGYNGQGDVEHYWRVGPQPGTTLSSSSVKTLEEAGCKYHYGTDNEGNEDRTIIYMVAPADPAGGLIQWWQDNYIYVFVTDDLHPESELFDGNGHLKKTPDEAHYIHAELCFSEKPQWELPNDTVCYGETEVSFNLERSDVAVSPGTTPEPDLTMLKFAFKPANGDEWQALLSYGDDPYVYSGYCTATNAEGVEKQIAVEMPKENIGDPHSKPDPNPELRIKGIDGKAIDSIFDSLVIRTVIRTDYSQTNDTLYTVLRIDRGLKAIAIVSPTEVAVCEGDATEFEVALERYNPSIPSKIEWTWNKRITDEGSGTGDVPVKEGDTKATPLEGSTTEGEPAPIKLTFLEVQPSDSGVWILSTDDGCFYKAGDAINLKVDLIPELGELSIEDDQFCSGSEALELTATVKNVNTAEIKWEHYHQNTVIETWTWVRDWDNGAGRVKLTNEAVDGNEYERHLTLTIDPAYLSDSGSYRLAVEPAVGSTCTYASESDPVHVVIDTTPQITISPKPILQVEQGVNGNVTATVSNPPSADDAACEQSAAGWYIFATTAGEDDPALPIEEYYTTDEGSRYKEHLNFTAPTGSGSTLTISNTPLELDGLRMCYMTENCCGIAYSDTVKLAVQGDLALGEITGTEEICENETVTLTVNANMYIADPNNRIWEYRAPGATAWTAVPLGDGAFFGATAVETMEAAMQGYDATLTLTNVPYALDGFEFRFRAVRVKDGVPADYFTNTHTILVRPVNNLHVVVVIDPEPASPKDGRNTTTLKAVVYVGDAPDYEVDPEDPEAKKVIIPDNAKVLTEAELERYGYTVFDWYQFLRDHSAPAPNEPQTGTGTFKTDDGTKMHDQIFKLIDLDYDVHNRSHYFTVLRHGCFPEAGLPNQQGGIDPSGLHSDTALLRIYEDLVVEWIESDWWGGPDADSLDYGTKVSDLDTMLLPTDRVIGVDLETNPPLPDSWEERHHVSEVYFLRCGNESNVSLTVELRKGIQSNDEEWVTPTRQWYYRKSAEEEWIAIMPDKSFGSFDADGDGTLYLNSSRRQLDVMSVSYVMNGWQFKSVAYADYNEELGRYEYADSTPVLTLVISEPLPSPDELGFLPFEDEGSCEAYNYVFDVNAKHETYHYDWEIKRPGDEDYTPIDSLKNKDVFHYGPAAPEEDGTLIKVTLSNFCDTLDAEVELHVMTVEITSETDELCVDGTLELSATVTNGGDNPTYRWYVNGVEVPDATEQTFTFNPAELPEGVTAGDNGQYDVQVQVKADPSMEFVNPMACAEKTVTVHPLPTFTVEADPTEVEASGTTTLSVSGQSTGSRVAWTPTEEVVAPSQAVTESAPLESGSHWFYATVRDEHGCSATDSVEVIVESSFTLDSAVAVVVVQPALPQFGDPQGGGGQGGGQGGGGGYETPDTTLVVITKDDTLKLIACENSIAFVTLCTSGGDAPLRYTWEGISPMTSDDLAEFGYINLELPDSVFALYLDGELTAFTVTIAEKDGNGLSVRLNGVIEYYVTQHVALEAIPHMRHNRYYENQIIFFTSHPGRFSWYNYYDYNATTDEVLKEQHNAKNLYQTDYVYEEGAERLVYVSVADKHGCRSYDSVELSIMPLPNAMVCNDPNYPEGCLLFPEFEVEIHDSWGRLVKAMEDGLGWDGTRKGKPVEVGTYYYKVKLPTADGHTYINGAVTVFTKKK